MIPCPVILRMVSAHINIIFFLSKINLYILFENSFTKNLSDNNKKINDIINNLDTTTRQLKDADLSKTVKEIQVVVQELTQTLHNLNNGDGSAAKLLNDPEIYKQLQGTIKSINTLVDDVKTHPKRYVNISVFGKKDKTTPLLKPIADTTTNE
jgi:phospholipid/cholesterol/gamma-HCH transport system substrate-binding protein